MSGINVYMDDVWLLHKKNKYSDHYHRKLRKALQEALDIKANNSRQSKAERKKENREKQSRLSDESKICQAVGSTIQSLNMIIDGNFSFHADRWGDTIVAINYPIGYEVVYKKIYVEKVDSENSVANTIKDTFEIEDRLKHEFDWKKIREKIAEDRGWWYETHRPHSPQLKFKQGGKVASGSDTHFDCCDALIGKDEHIVEAPAVRGLGFGSYTLGHFLLYQLRNFWRMRGKNYAHRR